MACKSSGGFLTFFLKLTPEHVEDWPYFPFGNLGRAPLLSFASGKSWWWILLPAGAQKEHEAPGLDIHIRIHPPCLTPSSLVFPVSTYIERVWEQVDTAKRKLGFILAATDRQCFPTGCVPHRWWQQISACSGLYDSWDKLNPRSATFGLPLAGCFPQTRSWALVGSEWPQWRPQHSEQTVPLA